jgi:CDGSH-type Zn-finger protein
MSTESKPTTSIQPATDGPYLVRNLAQLGNRAGAIETSASMALCRCGGSANKPFCDGTHARIGFSSAKLGDRLPDRQVDYRAERITIHDNRSLCAHAGYCTQRLASVFLYGQEPWIDPRGASAEDIIATIRACPSGALSYTASGAAPAADTPAQAAIFVAPNGPYVVTGAAQLSDSAPAAGADAERYTLCRCGGSKNKPFCDGSHWNNGFVDEKN